VKILIKQISKQWEPYFAVVQPQEHAALDKHSATWHALGVNIVAYQESTSQR
jgi:hypothetical protein